MTPRWRQARIALRLRRVLGGRARYDAGTEAERAAWRTARLAQLRRHAAEASPFYRRHHRGLERAPLGELPVLRRTELVGQFDDVVCDRSLTLAQLTAFVDHGVPGSWLRRRYRVGASSGSAGRPALFVFDEREWTGLLANAARARSIAGPGGAGTGRVRSARVGSPSPWHLSTQVGTTLEDPRRPGRRFPATAPIGELVDGLQAWQPSVLTAYPSILRVLADEQVGGRLAIAPSRVFAGGEVLTAGTRARVAAAWGTEPFDQYACTEAGFVAAECSRRGHLHVLDDHVLVEVVDEAGQPVAPGELGSRLLVTVLGSRTLPLIRYELDDRIRLDPEPCPAHHQPAIAAVAGRARELVRLPGRDGPVAVHPVAFTSVLDPMPLRGWQVVAEPGRVRVLVAAPDQDHLPDRVAEEVRRSLAAAGVVGVCVVVEPVDEVRRAGSGKASLVVSVEP